MKKRSQLLWFKFFAQDWMDGTRSLPPWVRALFLEVLIFMYEYDGPVPDDAKWISHKLHVPVRTWSAARTMLIASGKLSVVEGNLTNARAVAEIKSRAEQCATNKRIAIERERQRKEQRQPGADLETRRTEVGDVDERDAESVGDNSNSPSKSNNGIARVVTRACHHAHARENHHQIQNENENSSLVSDDQELKASSFSVRIDDDCRHSDRRVPPSLVKELGLRVGEDRASEIVAEYEASSYARDAKVLSAAFRGWVRNTHDITISGRGSALSVGEILAFSGPLPNASSLAARQMRKAAHD